jgi:hypothetical protein
MILLLFLADLMTRHDKQEAFNRDPEAAMKQAGLSDAQRELLWHHDAEGIGKAIAKEFRDFESCLRMPWPSSSIKVMAASPAQGNAGEVVRVTVSGLFFDGKATCALTRGQDRLEGKLLAPVQSDFQSSMDVAFDLTGGPGLGAWDLQVANDDEHYDTLPLYFEIKAAAPPAPPAAPPPAAGTPPAPDTPPTANASPADATPSSPDAPKEPSV